MFGADLSALAEVFFVWLSGTALLASLFRLDFAVSIGSRVFAVGLTRQVMMKLVRVARAVFTMAGVALLAGVTASGTF